MARRPKTKSPVLRAAVESAAATIGPVVSIDPVTLIAALSTLFTLISSWCPRKSQETQLRAVQKAYDPVADTYDPNLMERFEVAARKALRREGVKRPKIADIRAVARAAADQIRLAEPAMVTAARGEIEGNPDTAVILAECG